MVNGWCRCESSAWNTNLKMKRASYLLQFYLQIIACRQCPSAEISDQIMSEEVGALSGFLSIQTVLSTLTLCMALTSFFTFLIFHIWIHQWLTLYPKLIPAANVHFGDRYVLTFQSIEFKPGGIYILIWSWSYCSFLFNWETWKETIESAEMLSLHYQQYQLIKRGAGRKMERSG